MILYWPCRIWTQRKKSCGPKDPPSDRTGLSIDDVLALFLVADVGDEDPISIVLDDSDTHSRHTSQRLR